MKTITKTEIRKALSVLPAGDDYEVGDFGVHKFYESKKHPESFGLRSFKGYENRPIHEYFEGLQRVSFDEAVDYLYSNVNK